MSAATIDDDLPAPPAEPGKGELEALVRAAGLTVEAVETVALLQRYASIQALWDGWLAAAIRTGPLLAAQPRAAQQAARRALDGLVAPYLGPDGAVDLPVGVTITTATRPRA